MTAIVQITAQTSTAATTAALPAAAAMARVGVGAATEVDDVTLSPAARQSVGAASVSVEGELADTAEAPDARMHLVMANLQDLAQSQSEARRKVVDSAMAAMTAHRSRVDMLQDPAAALAAQAHLSPAVAFGLLKAA